MFEKLRQTIVYFRIIVDGAESLQKAAADTILDTSDIRKKRVVLVANNFMIVESFSAGFVKIFV